MIARRVHRWLSSRVSSEPAAWRSVTPMVPWPTWVSGHQTTAVHGPTIAEAVQRFRRRHPERLVLWSDEFAAMLGLSGAIGEALDLVAAAEQPKRIGVADPAPPINAADPSELPSILVGDDPHRSLHEQMSTLEAIGYSALLVRDLDDVDWPVVRRPFIVSLTHDVRGDTPIDSFCTAFDVRPASADDLLPLLERLERAGGSAPAVAAFVRELELRQQR